MSGTYEITIAKQGEILLDAVLDEEDALEAIRLRGPRVVLQNGATMTPKKILTLAVLNEGTWQWADYTVMAKRAKP